MADIEKFTVSNFRGIEQAEISLSERVSTPVITLVGLNESGKTTVLEALSHFVTGDDVVSEIFEGSGASSQTLSLIPIHKKANFTGSIKITALVRLGRSDLEKFSEIALSKFSLVLDEEAIGEMLEVSKEYVFRDGNYDQKTSGAKWNISLKVKTKKAKKFDDYKPSGGTGDNLSTAIWWELRKRLPSVSYFPTFLVDLPSRIYLREYDEETPTNRHYRYVLQDVLDSLDEGLDLEKHVAKRIEDYKLSDRTPNWFSIFLGTPAKAQVMSVIQKLGHAISREIIGSWSKIFHTPTSARTISLEFSIDAQKEDMPYVTFIISDGESQFSLHCPGSGPLRQILD